MDEKIFNNGKIEGDKKEIKEIDADDRKKLENKLKEKLYKDVILLSIDEHPKSMEDYDYDEIVIYKIDNKEHVKIDNKEHVKVKVHIGYPFSEFISELHFKQVDSEWHYIKSKEIK